MLASEGELDDVETENCTPKKKRKVRNELHKKEQPLKKKQKFKQDWKLEKGFKDWLESISNNAYKARCKICNQEMSAEISVLQRHSKSKGHLLKTNSSDKQNKIEIYASTSKQESQDNETKRAEIKLCAFASEHNLSFLMFDHLTDLIKDCFPDSDIAKKLALKRTKATAIVKNVIGECHQETMIHTLKTTKFSILVDESTDISCTKTVCIIVRFFDANVQRIQSKFFELVQLFDKDNKDVRGDSEHLFNVIVSTFKNKNIPLENIIGFGSDGCNVMFGEHNSVVSRLKVICPDIVVMKCICHSLHICASEACKMLPRIAEDLCRDIYGFFKLSSKRQALFKQFQEFLNLDVLKLLHPSQTRWLSLNHAVQRIVQNWEALKLFFNDMWLSERLVSAETIHKCLHDPLMKCYYLFLAWVLRKFTALNVTYFQSEKTIIVDLYDKMALGFKDLLLCYLKKDYVLKSDLSKINTKDEKHFLRHTEIYLGVEVLKEKENLNDSMKKEFYFRCINFLSTACYEIQKRFNFNHKGLQLISALKPKNALSTQTRENTPSLYNLANEFKQLVDFTKLQNIDNEWRKLILIDLPSNINANDDADIFYAKLKEIVDSDGISEFANLSNFALTLLSLPNSNADCERIFSKVNLIKTRTRNKLITSTINSHLLTSQEVKTFTCVKYEPTREMIKKMNNTKSLYNVEDEDSFHLKA